MARVTWASEVIHGPGSRARITPAHVETASAPVQQPVGEWGDWVWRHRRKLRAPVVIGGLAALSTWGHLLAPGLAWAPLPASLAAAAVVAVAPLPKRERDFALLWLWPAASWTTASWAAGIDSLAVMGALLLLGGAAIAHWNRLQGPRSRIEVIGGSPWPWHWTAWRSRARARRQLRHIARVWSQIAEASGVPGAALRRLVADVDAEDGRALHVTLARGHTGATIRADRLRSALREFPVAIVTPDPGRPWEVVLEEVLLASAAAMDEDAEEEQGLAPAPGPEPMDQLAERLDRLRRALQEAGGPLSIRKLAKATGLEPTWVWRTGLPELQRSGEVVKGADGKWNLVSEVAA